MTCEWGCTAGADRGPAPAKSVAVLTALTDGRWSKAGTVWRILVCGVHGNAVMLWQKK